MILQDSSFSNITFDKLFGRNIIKISNNAFGKASSTIKTIHINYNRFYTLNHFPPDYDVWSVFKGFKNIEKIRVHLNITKIPYGAFGNLKKLKDIDISSNNNITIKSKAFYYLDNLESVNFECGINTIENEAFAFDKKLNPFLFITFFYGPVNMNNFMLRAFDGIKRNVVIDLYHLHLNFISESSFKSVLKESFNSISFYKSTIDCNNCLNYWLIRDSIKHVKDTQCINYSNLTLFSDKIKSDLTLKCKYKFGDVNDNVDGGAFGIYHSNMSLTCLLLSVYFINF